MNDTSAAETTTLQKGMRTAAAVARSLRDREDDGYRTPIYKDQDAGNILDAWMGQLEGLKMSKELVTLENREKSKFGPYYAVPWKHWKGNLDAYYSHSSVPFNLDESYLSIEERMYLTNSLRIDNTKLRQYTVDDAYRLSRKGTNLGLPVMSSTWNETTLSHYLPRSRTLVAGEETRLFPFVMFRRIQPNGYRDKEGIVRAKQRPVWGADHAETFAGLTVLYPLLDRMQKMKEFSHLLGIDHLEKVLQSELPRYQWRLSLDFSAVDATFGPRWLLAGLAFVNDIVDVHPSFLEGLYYYYSEGDIITPDGTKRGTHGLPSGCSLTNVLETLCLHAITCSYLDSIGCTDRVLFQNGDDGLVLCNQEIDLNHMAAFFHLRGLVMNVDKTLFSREEGHYLQRQFVRSSGDHAVMSTVRMLGRILFSERGVDVGKVNMSVGEFWTINTISKLENCKRHPYFREFVDFVNKGDRFHLRAVPVSAKMSVNNQIFQAVNGAPELGSGFESLETVRILRLLEELRGDRGSRSRKTVMSDS